MTNPLDNQMQNAETRMAIENMREMMASQIDAVKLLAKIQAEHLKALVEEGVKEDTAAMIVAIHYRYEGGEEGI